VAFLDAQKEVDKAKKIGTQGYCMGGPLVVKTAAALPDRIGAGASFHGGGLVTAKPDSPHLHAPKIKARMYFGIASNDDARQPDAKDKLKEAFTAAKVPAEIEVYAGALHGWCVPDMPKQDPPIYSKPDAERQIEQNPGTQAEPPAPPVIYCSRTSHESTTLDAELRPAR